MSMTSTNNDWSFKELTTKDTGYVTHGYHRYPAKFIPQLASRIINEYSNIKDLVVDPFMGSGTTLIESKLVGRESIGIDINPVAHLISKAKISALDTKELIEYFENIKEQFIEGKIYPLDFQTFVSDNERIDYWFKPEEKAKLGIIYKNIIAIKNEEVRIFFMCSFSHILKNSSIWLMKSNKPTRDRNKVIPDPYKIFSSHTKKMINKNKLYNELLDEKGFKDVKCNAILGDSRKVPILDNEASLMVTSPPYVTSYEYADLHQLSAFWFKFTDSLSSFRENFMGSSSAKTSNEEIGSDIALKIIEELSEKNTKKNKEVATYFSQMYESFKEMKRYLKKGGIAAIVIGNTSFKGVPILNAEVFIEQLENIGFKKRKIINREVPSKILPSTRDKKTGKFAKLKDSDLSVYSNEHIIIMEKK